MPGYISYGKSSVPVFNDRSERASQIKDLMWSHLMINGQSADIDALKDAVNTLITASTQKTSGQAKYAKASHVDWNELDMVLWNIIFQASALVLSGDLDKLNSLLKGGDLMNVIAGFHRISFEQFMKDFNEAFPELDAHSTYNALKLPRRATKGSAGYDFFSPVAFSLAPGESIKFPSGIRARIDEGWVLKIYPRSGLGFKYRLQLDNSVGIIDSDYFDSDNEGHIFFKITNDSKDNKEIHIERGAAFAQGIFVPFGITLDDVVTAERNGGLGSTDRASADRASNDRA